MRRIICALLALALLPAGAALAEEKLTVIAAIAPVYDWVRAVAGDRADAAPLLDGGVDLHSYQPSAQDLLRIATCDVFIYVGGESDGWVADALRNSGNPNRVTLNLLEALGDAAVEEEAVEGMQRDGDAEEEGAYDEHVWLSLRNAAALTRAIADTLSAADPAHAADYAANAGAYVDRLEALDKRYAEAIAAAPLDTLLFGDRFPFRYLTDDYDLRYYAAFAGCSAETEASFETVVFLAGKVDELGLPAVLTIDGSDGRIARTIVEATASRSARILTLNSMQSAPEAGAGYLGIMEANLDALLEALGEKNNEE